MNTKELGPGSSPDNGSFWRKGGRIYFEDGSVFDDAGFVQRESLFEIPESEWHKYENYSAWSDEKRAEVMAAKKAERDKYEAEVKVWEDEVRTLKASAKAKLTEDEWEAVNTELDDE